MGDKIVTNGDFAANAAMSNNNEIEGAAAYMLSSLSFNERKLADDLQYFERISKDGLSVSATSLYRSCQHKREYL